MSHPSLDILRNRQAQKYSAADMFRRAFWDFGSLLFRFSPRPCFGWRRFILRCFGARIGQDVHIYNSAQIYFPWNLEVGDWSAIGEKALIYNLGMVTIGQKVTISHCAHLCAGTHDYRRIDLPLLRPPIVIKDEAWICSDAFIGPGVIVGHGAVVGARSVAMKNVDAWTVVGGNPAQFIKKREMEDA